MVSRVCLLFFTVVCFGEWLFGDVASPNREGVCARCLIAVGFSAVCSAIDHQKRSS